MDEHTQDFVETFGTFMREVVNQNSLLTDRVTPLGAMVEDFLGTSIRELPIVTQTLASHRLVDADLALSELADRCGAAPLGVSGGQQRDHSSLSELLNSQYARFGLGPVDYLSIPSGPATVRQVVSFGIYLLTHAGGRAVVLQRAAQPERGRQFASLEVLADSEATSAALLAEFARLLLSTSILRGQVLTFSHSTFGPGAGGTTFLERPTIEAQDVILPPGVLDSVVRHVVGIGENRDRLREAGQHLKRGVLLYGPPGTGKTLTVRHLLARTPGTTAVLLTGPAIAFITEAAELARAMQPAIVVLEDVDLVASERGMHGGPQPLLFAILDALDGLDGDADVTFILTTNRVDVLERALAERPGRIDLAVEIPLPDLASRELLFRRYALGLPLSPSALDRAAQRAAGTTGSFAKELIRRSVLAAAESGREVDDNDLDLALDDLLSSNAALTRSLLGGATARE
ncbi:AAA family ATPase [soil metagenome]